MLANNILILRNKIRDAASDSWLVPCDPESKRFDGTQIITAVDRDKPKNSKFEIGLTHMTQVAITQVSLIMFKLRIG